MWNLDDTTRYQKFACLDIPKAVTWADMRPDHTDKEKREMIRSVAAATLSQPIPAVQSWAFRIFVRKSGRRPFDIENTLKIIIDSFSRRQIRKNCSPHERLALYDDEFFTEILRGTGFAPPNCG
jgi:hypothetical protein